MDISMDIIVITALLGAGVGLAVFAIQDMKRKRADRSEPLQEDPTDFVLEPVMEPAAPAARKEPEHSVPQLHDLMPQLMEIGGEPGTATEAQIEDVRALHMGMPPGLSFEQAHTLVNAWAYAEGVIYVIIGRVSYYDNERLIEASLVDYIMRDKALRDCVIAWDEWAPGRGSTDVPVPPRDQHYGKVEAEAIRLLESLGY